MQRTLILSMLCLAGTVADNSYKTTVDPQRFADNAAAMVSAVQSVLVAQLKREFLSGAVTAIGETHRQAA